MGTYGFRRLIELVILQFDINDLLFFWTHWVIDPRHGLLSRISFSSTLGRRDIVRKLNFIFGQCIDIHMQVPVVFIIGFCRSNLAGLNLFERICILNNFVNFELLINKRAAWKGRERSEVYDAFWNATLVPILTSSSAIIEFAALTMKLGCLGRLLSVFL